MIAILSGAFPILLSATIFFAGFGLVLLLAGARR
jgi:hypothetical protein